MNTNRLKFAVLGFFAFLIGMQIFLGCNRTPETQPINTNLLPEAKVAEATNVPIEGLFGIKLGKPLSPECAIEHDLGMINGQIEYSVIPPQTNAAFDNYSVKINPTSRLVCEIRASSVRKDDKEESLCVGGPASVYDVLTALREKYGKELLDGAFASKAKPEGLFQRYIWRHGDRSLCLYPMGSSFFLSCTDDTLNHPVFDSANTNGF
jgi:hypothetical protein